MSDQNDRGTLLNVKRVTEETNQGKKQDQDKHLFCIGENSDGSNEFDKLLEVLQQYKGKQVNFDFRVTDKEHQGRKYRGAFLIVKEMVPKAQQPNKKTDIKAKADEIRQKLG